jgi:hypothetical protein
LVCKEVVGYTNCCENGWFSFCSLWILASACYFSHAWILFVVPLDSWFIVTGRATQNHVVQCLPDVDSAGSVRAMKPHFSVHEVIKYCSPPDWVVIQKFRMISRFLLLHDTTEFVILDCAFKWGWRADRRSIAATERINSTQRAISTTPLLQHRQDNHVPDCFQNHRHTSLDLSGTSSTTKAWHRRLPYQLSR